MRKRIMIHRKGIEKREYKENEKQGIYNEEDKEAQKDRKGGRGIWEEDERGWEYQKEVRRRGEKEKVSKSGQGKKGREGMIQDEKERTKYDKGGERIKKKVEKKREYVRK